MIPFIILAIEDPADEAFMEDLYLSYKRLMLSHIRKVLSGSAEAEDILQTALVKLIDRIPLLKTLGEKDKSNYIIAVCRHEAVSFLRKNKPLYYMEDADLNNIEDQADTPELWVLTQERLENTHRAWQKLDEKSKALLTWKYRLELSDAEIAKNLGIQPNSVRTYLTRARNNLKQKINETETV